MTSSKVRSLRPARGACSEFPLPPACSRCSCMPCEALLHTLYLYRFGIDEYWVMLGTLHVRPYFACRCLYSALCTLVALTHVALRAGDRPLSPDEDAEAALQYRQLIAALGLGGSDRRPAGTTFYTSKVIDPNEILPGEVVLLCLALVQQLCASAIKWCDDVNDAVNTGDNIFHPAWRAPLALRQGSINDTIQNLKMTGSDYEHLGNAMLKYGIVQHEAPSTADICKYAALASTLPLERASDCLCLTLVASVCL
jgi:hypothetical protein